MVHPKYKELQELRGIHPNILYQYLCLRKISKITEFVTHFPQYKQMYWKFNELLLTLRVQTWTLTQNHNSLH